MMRISEAKEFEKEFELTERTAWFFFQYNWQTREKSVFRDDGLPNDPSLNDNKWCRRYRIQVHLPIPTFADQRKEIHSIGEVLYDEDAKIDYTKPLKYQIARVFFSLSVRACPGISPDPLRITWEGDVFDFNTSSFTMQAHGKKFRVTVTEIEGD